MTTSRTEIQVATNDVLYKQAFYSAEGGAEIGREMIEQNLACFGAFSDSALNDDDDLVLEDPASGTSFFRVTNHDFALQESIDLLAVFDENSDGTLQDSEIAPSDTQKDLWFGDSNYIFSDYDSDGDGEIDPASDNLNLPHTNVIAFGDTSLSTGSAVQVSAGYKGKGTGSAGGGGNIIYQVHSRHEYPSRNSVSHVLMEYRHVIGMEGSCQY